MKSKFQNLTQRIKRCYLSACTTIALIHAGIIPTFAGPTAVNPDEMVGNLIGIVCSIFTYIGILLLVWGIGQLVLAFKNEDADSKSRAMMLLIASVVLMSVRTIITNLGLGITIGPGLSGK